VSRDNDVCCTGNCSQAHECPRYRQPAPKSDSRVTVWFLDAIGALAVVLLAWGFATYGDSLRAWLGLAA